MVSCCVQSSTNMHLRVRYYLLFCVLAALCVVLHGKNDEGLLSDEAENGIRIQGRETKQSRMHRTLKRARMKQLSTLGRNAKDEISPEIPLEPKRARSVAADARRSQRTVGRLTSLIQSMGKKVVGLEEWKSDYELRMAQLEIVVEQLKQQVLGTNGGHGVNDLLAGFGSDTEGQLASRNDIASGIKDRDALLHQIDENDESVQFNGATSHSRRGGIAKRHAAVSGSEIDNLAATVGKLNKTIVWYGKIMYRVYSRVGRSQRYAAGRFAILERKIRQFEAKVESQQLTLSLLQNDIFNSTALISQAKRETAELAQNYSTELNETFTETLHALKARVRDNSASITSLTEVLSEQAGDSNSLAADIAYLHDVQQTQGGNISDSALRISEKENRIEELQESILTLQKLTEKGRDARKTINESIGEFHLRLDTIEQIVKKNENNSYPEKLDRLRLNLTALKASLKSQMANLSSALESVQVTDTIINKNVQGLVEKMSTQESKLDAALQTYHRDANERIDGLEAKLAPCCSSATANNLRNLNATIKSLKQGQERKLDAVEKAIENGEKRIADVELRTEMQVNVTIEIQNNASRQQRRIAKAEVSLAEIMSSTLPNIQRSVDVLLSTAAELQQVTNGTLLQRSAPQAEFSSLEFENRTSDLVDLHAKFDNMATHQSEAKRTHEAAMNVTTSSILSNKKEIEELKLSVKSEMKELADAQSHKLSRVSGKIASVKAKLLSKIDRRESSADSVTKQFELRLIALEASNVSVHADVKLCLEAADAVKEINASSIEERLSYIRSDIDFNYNSTELLFDLLDSQGERLSILDGEATRQISSLTSSVARLDSAFQESNDSLRHEMEDVKIWLTDFQDAFVTSIRELGRHTEDFLVAKKNTSNHFIRLTTSVNYITQILQETIKSVDENKESLKIVNETILYLALSSPSLSATADDEENFDYKDDAFSFGDFETRSLDGNTRRQPGGLLDRQTSMGQERRQISESVFTGDADEIRQRQRAHAWMTKGDYGAESYIKNYGLRAVERRKRFVQDIRRIDREVSFMLNAMVSLQSSVHRIENASEIREVPTPMVQEIHKNAATAFSVGLTFTHECCGTVIFDKVFTNRGSGYNPSTGKFVTPAENLYVFFVTILERNRFISAALVMNGMPLITVRMDHSNGDYEQSQSTNTVIVRLNVGDQVWLQTYTGSLQGYQSPAVTFSGFSIA